MAENVVIFDNHGSNAASVPEVDIRPCRRQFTVSVSTDSHCYSPADTSALHCDCDLTRSQLLAALDLLERRLRLGHPKIMCRVGVNTNVRQRRLGQCLCGSHCGGESCEGGLDSGLGAASARKERMSRRKKGRSNREMKNVTSTYLNVTLVSF